VEPEFWQAKYESGETRWDKGAAAPPLLEYLSGKPVLGRWLVPGCGTGHDVRALAAVGAQSVGLDFAPAAIDAARAAPRVGTESYLAGNFLQLPVEFVGTFDGIFEHTCFCAIRPEHRRAYAASCAAALRPGGELLAIFYLEPREAEDDGCPPFRTDWSEIPGLFGGKFELVDSWEPAVCHPGREGRERMARLIRR
jgi:methyl halide transferase